ncbi:MAG TPA: helix-turn-helix domain-containing protein [Pyrinomonadaceae bacterium]|nr:helix-turn-helix domain-containing protein [Pyrinomonadaceae bacterium]
MTQTLGEKLRSAREARGISISEVAEQTRISPLYLQAIDSDDYKTLPGGIFNKGFVRSYAKYVGVDENEALQDYNRIVEALEKEEDDKLGRYRPEVLTDDRAVTSLVPTVIFAAIILGIMTGGLLLLVNYIQNRQSEVPLAVNGSAVNSGDADRPEAVVNSDLSTSVPTMDAVKVEFRTSGEDIWLNSVSDGTTTSSIVSTERPVTFEPRQELRLSYSRSLAQAAQLSINGKSIALPESPTNPKRQVIEIDLNKNNLASVWQAGSFDAGLSTSPSDVNTSTAPTVRTTPKPAPSPRAANEEGVNTAPSSGVPTMTNRPANSNRPTMTERPSATPRPAPANARSADNSEPLN